MSPGVTMRIKVMRTPPIRLESVSCKPKESAIPPTPKAATTAVILTLKQASATIEIPIAQIMQRAILMKNATNFYIKTMAMNTRITAATMMRPSKSPPVIWFVICSSSSILFFFTGTLLAYRCRPSLALYPKSSIVIFSVITLNVLALFMQQPQCELFSLSFLRELPYLTEEAGMINTLQESNSALQELTKNSLSKRAKHK